MNVIEWYILQNICYYEIIVKNKCTINTFENIIRLKKTCTNKCTELL